MITPESIDRVREAADIVEIVGEHVKLRRTGADFRGPCPFHNGKGPNFSVSPRRGAFHCFVCHASGDVFSFVREKLGLDFADAVRYVAARAGVEVQETAGRADERTADPREPLWEALAAAAEFYRAALWDDDEARGARDYLASRDVARDAADRFGLGWAPRDAGPLRQHLAALGHEDDRLLAAGLLARREGEEEIRPRFRGRLMFPILDASGRHVGFGGRVIGQGEPKYLNSPESEVFSKGRLLYGLSWARHPVRKADRALVVEGYFDAMRLALAGIEEAVAPLGTALTEQQAGLLAKLTRNVFLLYDGDKAGLTATFRSGLALLRLGVSARVVSLPAGEDPDTFVRAHGAERLEAHLAQAVDIFDRQVIELRRRGWFEDLHRKRKAIDKLLPTLRAAADPMTREIYAGRLAEVAGIDRDVILREAEQPERGRPGSARPPAPPRDEGRGDGPGDWRGRDASPRPGARMEPLVGGLGVEFVEPRRPSGGAPWDREGRARPGSNDRRRGRGRRDDDWASSQAVARVSPKSGVIAAERGLVQGMLHDPDLVAGVAERWGPEHFHHPGYRRIFERLLAMESAELAGLADGLPAEDVELVNALLAEPLPGASAAAHVEAWLRRLEVRALDEERDRINARLLDVDHPLSDEEKDALIRRKAQLGDERRALSAHWNQVGRRMSPPS